jgi:hypothetical protein
MVKAINVTSKCYFPLFVAGASFEHQEKKSGIYMDLTA